MLRNWLLIIQIKREAFQIKGCKFSEKIVSIVRNIRIMLMKFENNQVFLSTLGGNKLSHPANSFMHVATWQCVFARLVSIQTICQNYGKWVVYTIYNLSFTLATHSYEPKYKLLHRLFHTTTIILGNLQGPSLPFTQLSALINIEALLALDAVY